MLKSKESATWPFKSEKYTKIYTENEINTLQF